MKTSKKVNIKIDRTELNKQLRKIKRQLFWGKITGLFKKRLENLMI